MIVEEYIGKEIDSLERSIVSTPKSRENLDQFAKANMGSMDIILTQMAVQYGYKLALDNIADICKQKTNTER